MLKSQKNSTVSLKQKVFQMFVLSYVNKQQRTITKHLIFFINKRSVNFQSNLKTLTIWNHWLLLSFKGKEEMNSMTAEQAKSKDTKECIYKHFLGRMKSLFNSDFFVKTLISFTCGIMFAYLMIAVWDKYQTRYKILINKK